MDSVERRLLIEALSADMRIADRVLAYGKPEYAPSVLVGRVRYDQLIGYWQAGRRRRTRRRIRVSLN